MGKSAFPKELEAIRKLRDMFPNASQTRLANRIVAKDFVTEPEAMALMSLVNGRSYYSVYSVIRRYDAAKIAAADAAKVQAKKPKKTALAA